MSRTRKNAKTVKPALTIVEDFAGRVAGQARENYEAYPSSYVNPTQAFDEVIENMAWEFKSEGVSEADRVAACEKAAQMLGGNWFDQHKR